MMFKDDPNPLSPKKVRKDILEALQTEPFPIRGWHLTLSFLDGFRYAYPVHSSKAELNAEGIPEEKPPVLFYVESKELVLTADFRLEACKVLGGRPWQCPKEAEERQWLRFANTNGSLEVILDAQKVPPYQERVLYPKREEWLERVQWWAKRWNESGKADDQARGILVQLDGIRDSANHILHQAMGRLVERIQKDVPDYWLLAEAAMAGRLTKEEIQAIDEYSVGKGALVIRTFVRPVSGPTKKVQ
jgi:hypothetical protein